MADLSNWDFDIKNVNIRGYATPEEMQRVVNSLEELIQQVIDLYVAEDAKRKGDLDFELERFRYMAELAKATGNYFFVSDWAEKSQNCYAEAYRLGGIHKIQKNNTESVKRATNGRRLIGATSREKVRATAEKFKHLSKESAAPDIAESVGLSAGTVRRYLSELFPGVEWSKL